MDKKEWWILGGTAVVAGGIGVLIGKYAMAAPVSAAAAGYLPAGRADSGHNAGSGGFGTGSPRVSNQRFAGFSRFRGTWVDWWPYYSYYWPSGFQRSECDVWMRMSLLQKQEFVRARIFPNVPLRALTAEQMDQIDTGVNYIDVNSSCFVV